MYFIYVLFYLYFPPSSHPIFVSFFSVGLSLLKHFEQVLRELKLPVENFVLTTKDLQERNIQMLDGTTVENKRKTIN